MSLDIKIGNSIINKNSSTYFIADIASNHDGSLSKAKELIQMCAEAGSNAAKFQNFTGETLICDSVFSKMGNIAHQKKWKKSTFDGYNEVSVPLSWTEDLKAECEKNNIDYFTAPYCIDFIESLNDHVSAWKVGSGDITYHESIIKMANTGKTVIIATGASKISEVEDIIKKIIPINKKLILMQCNTNYTASVDNFKYIQLNVLKLYSKLFPELILGLSDHTPGHSTVLGSIALGAKVIEKHFTDNNDLTGPDHKFSMNPKDWREMVDRARELEEALGSENKKIEDNEKETVIIQRRGIRAKNKILEGEIIKEDNLTYLRPCSEDCLPPYQKDLVIGKKAKLTIEKDQAINTSNTE